MSIRQIDEITYHDHLVLIDGAHNKLLVLNPVATVIWEFRKQGLDSRAIATELVNLYGIPLDVAMPDVDNMFEAWRHAGLLPGSEAVAETPRADIFADSEFFNPALASRFDVPVAHHYRIGKDVLCIRYHSSNWLDMVHTRLSHFETTAAAPDHQYDIDLDNNHYIIRYNGKELVAEAGGNIILSDLFESILRHAYPGLDMLALIHAAAFGVGGSAIVLPAVSGSGKSTLSAGLMSAGYEYLGDDLVPIRFPDRKITPFLTSLSIKDGSWDIIGEIFPTLQTGRAYTRFGRTMRYLDVPESKMQESLCRDVSHMIFPRYSADEPESLQVIEPAEALTRLVDDNAWLGYPLQAERIRVFLDWLEQKQLYSMTYRSLEQAIDWINEITAE